MVRASFVNSRLCRLSSQSDVRSMECSVGRMYASNPYIYDEISWVPSDQIEVQISQVGTKRRHGSWAADFID